MTAFHALLALHIAGGGVALLAGPVPMLSRKGSPVHRKAGKVYAVAMLVASVSAFVLAAITGNILLLGLAVLTFFLVFSGVRAIGFRRGGRPVLLDQTVCVLTIGFSAWLLWHGVTVADITSVFFGAGGLFLAIRHLQTMQAQSPNWLNVHLVSMGGGYIATVSAFLVVNLTAFLPAAVVFITPTLIGVPLIVWASRRYRRGGPTAVATA